MVNVTFVKDLEEKKENWVSFLNVPLGFFIADKVKSGPYYETRLQKKLYCRRGDVIIIMDNENEHLGHYDNSSNGVLFLNPRKPLSVSINVTEP